MSFIFCADVTKTKKISVQNKTGVRIISLTLKLVDDTTENNLMEKSNKMLGSVFSGLQRCCKVNKETKDPICVTLFEDISKELRKLFG